MPFLCWSERQLSCANYFNCLIIHNRNLLKMKDKHHGFVIVCYNPAHSKVNIWCIIFLTSSLLSRTNSSQPADPRSDTKVQQQKNPGIFQHVPWHKMFDHKFVLKIYVNIWFQAGLPPNWWQLAKDNQTKVIQQNDKLNCMLSSYQKWFRCHR